MYPSRGTVAPALQREYRITRSATRTFKGTQGTERLAKRSPERTGRGTRHQRVGVELAVRERRRREEEDFSDLQRRSVIKVDKMAFRHAPRGGPRKEHGLQIGIQRVKLPLGTNTRHFLGLTVGSPLLAGARGGRSNGCRLPVA